jgi:hypothetical protein
MPYTPTGRRVGRPGKEDAFKPVSVKLPPDLLDRVRQYAAIHQQSLSELIRDGLEWRITEGDVGYFRNTEIISTSQPDTGNTVILQEVKRLVERLSAVVGAAEAPSAQVVREEEDAGNTVLQEHDHQEYNNTVIQEKASGEKKGGSPHAPTAGNIRRGQYKLNRRQVSAMRAKRQRGVPIKALMEEYGLSKATVFRYLAAER